MSGKEEGGGRGLDEKRRREEYKRKRTDFDEHGHTNPSISRPKPLYLPTHRSLDTPQHVIRTVSSSSIF